MKIKVLKGGQPAGEFVISEKEGEEIWIGRSKDCAVILDDIKISRKQASLSFHEGKWKIKNSSKKQTLLINESPTQESDLSSGDSLQISSFVLELEIDAPPAPEEEAPTDEELPSAEEETEEEPSAEEEVEEEPLEEESFAEEEVEEEPLEEEPFVEEPSTEEESLEEDPPLEEFGNDFLKEESQEEESPSEDLADSFLQEEPQEHFQENIEEEESEEKYNDFDENENSSEEANFADDELEDGEHNYEMVESEEEGESGDKTKAISHFSTFVLDIFGEHAPYDSYTVEENETYIGRNKEKCQIFLNDPQVSSVHAVIKKKKSFLVLEDLDSGNGTILNGERINKKDLAHGDEFIIGSVAFTLKIESSFIEEQKEHLMPVEHGQVVEVEEVVEVDDFSDEGLPEEEVKDKSLVGKLKRAWKNPQERKKIIYGLAGVMLIWVFMDDGGEQKKVVKKKPKAKKAKVVKKPEDKLKPKQREAADLSYQLAKELFETAKYRQAIIELDKIFKITPKYKDARALYQASQEGLEKLEEIARKERKTKERLARERKINKLLEKAAKAVKERNVEYADQLIAQISQEDPENYELAAIKLELDAYKSEKARKDIEEAAKKAERNRQEQSLLPGKSFYSRENWHSAMRRFEELLEKEKNLDQDLLEEAKKMLKDSKKQLRKIVNPLLSKARSLKEGQDLKGAYENYMMILKHDPEHIESLNEMSAIREQLTIKSRKIYREAIIVESLSLFNQAKEKFQEVQQISPVDSEYYKKATEKLKEYLE